MNKNSFTPLVFLASLGAGGISVIPFAFFQYIYPHGEGLVKFPGIDHAALSSLMKMLFFSLEGIMVVFVVLHIVLSVVFFKNLIPFVKSKQYSDLINDPLKNAAILAPFISITMTMNVVIGPIRFFLPAIADNLQTIMPVAFAGWLVIYFLLMRIEVKLLKISFIKGFDISRINFGWLLHPFALAMVTVTGTGIAAMAENPSIAHGAVFLSLISLSMGLFLLLVKIITLFKSHFAAEGLPEKQFLPSFLIVIPNITLYAISLFRIGHYLEHHHGFHLDAYFLLVITTAFAFEVWYLVFGLALLRDYFKKHYLTGEFSVTQWGLVCPFVAFAVLGSFVYANFVASPWFIVIITIVTFFTVVLFFDLLIRHMRCAGILKISRKECR